ncbi:MAG TPA: hypothetical protein PKL70_02790 [Saprospiraceae bacterium]|nr:hypothetical protein [Saprospiraceae bacterium]
MKTVHQAVLYCLFIAIAHSAQAQCIEGRAFFTLSGDTTVYACPDGKPDLVGFRPFTGGTPFIYVITDQNDTIIGTTLTGVVDFENLPGSEYHVYGYSFKGALGWVLGKHILDARITDYCYERSTNYVLVIKEYPVAPVINQPGTGPLFVCAPDLKADSVKTEAVFGSRSKIKYLVADEKGIIVKTSDRPELDADQLECDSCKIYVLAYTGRFLGLEGNSIDAALSTGCYELSSDFQLLVRDLPRGGNILFASQDSQGFICAASTKAQPLSLDLSNNSAGYEHYIFTDTLNQVIALSDSASIPGDALIAGICRVWGLTFTGQLNDGYSGKDIHDFIWTDDCYAVTENFLQITKALPDGGQIAFKSDAGLQILCKDGVPDSLSLEVTGALGAHGAWVIVDTAGRVYDWTSSSSYDFNKLPAGEWKIYFLSYTGNLILAIGDSLHGAPSDDCYDYSDSSLTVVTDVPLPGLLTFSDSTTTKFFCASSSGNLVAFLNFTSRSSLNSALLLTDANDKLVRIVDSLDLNLDSLANGNYRIYSLSYSGDLLAETGQVLDPMNLSSGCSQLSDQYLGLMIEEVEAADISLENGQDSLTWCAGDTLSTTVLGTNAMPGTPHVFFVTDLRDSVLHLLDSDTLRAANLNSGASRIRGLSYSGQLLLQPGQLLSQQTLASGCAALSTNVIKVLKENPQGGRVSLVSGDTSYTICFKDGWPDRPALKSTSTSLIEYQYILTNEQNQIIDLNASELDLESLNSGRYRIYGVSYLGSVLAKAGDDMTAVPFASGCFQYSENAIQISSDELSAGTLRTPTGENVLYYCTDDSQPDTVLLTSNGATPGAKYAYLGIQSDTVKYISMDGRIIDVHLPAGTTRVFGVAYRGSLLVKAGDRVSSARLTDSCFSVTSNEVIIYKYAPEAGTLTTSGGQTEFFLCPQDGQPDFITVEEQGAVPLPYAYVITDEADSILAWSYNSSFDLDTFSLGLCRIYGISYSGNLQLFGKKLDGPDLSSGCFDVSGQFITVYKSTADAGRISLAGGDTVVTICVEDLAPDTLFFSHTGVQGLKYAYLVTDLNNRLQAIVEKDGPEFDFNGADPGTSRIYGVAYGGILSVFRNDDVTATALSTGCYDLSDNFILLNKVNSGPGCKTSGIQSGNQVFLSIFPNPALQRVTLSLKGDYLKSGKPELHLISVTGQLGKKINLSSEDIDNEKVVFDVTSLTPGLYFIIFKNGYIFDRVKMTVIR